MLRLPFDVYPLLRPVLFRLDPEFAHHLALFSLKSGLFPAKAVRPDPVLKTCFNGVEFAHPIGLAAGFDKQAEIMPQLFQLGFSSVEIGGVTPLPQPGNPKPRMFRIPEAQALINRFNLNNVGIDAFEARLRLWSQKFPEGMARPFLGVNIARGDNAKDDAAAYSLGLQKLAPYVAFATINISCPNECDARNLEARDQLRDLLKRIMETHAALESKQPLLLVKISPDLSEKQAEDIAKVAEDACINGLIVGNTTTDRPPEIPPIVAAEKGGLSGKPLFEKSTWLLGRMYQLTDGKMPLIGCGGVFTGEDAYRKIRAGASLVQIYTAMVYRGTLVVPKIAEELATLLKRDGFACASDAVGANYRKA